jgi:multidrug efflux system outer membrane protein
MMHKSLAALLVTSALAACGTVDTFHSEPVKLPARFSAAAENNQSTGAKIAWDVVFPDPALRSLIDESLKHGPSALQATAQVKEYAAIARVTRGSQLPSLKYSLTTSPVPRTEAQDLASSYYSGVGALWEIDLWGRYARAAEASRADWMSSEENLHGVTASLVGTVANLYYTLSALHKTEDLARAVANNQREGLKIIQRQTRAGILSAAEQRQQESALAATEALLPTIAQKIISVESQMTVLLGREPGAGHIVVSVDAISPAEVPAGVPSDLLLRRPDIRGAEANLRAAHARVEVARSLFFPDVSLTGAFGSASTALGAALHGRDSKLASLGPKVDLAIFSGGALRANRDAALARQEQAVIAYHQTVSAAFAEVATDLHAIRNSAEVREIQNRRSESAVEARRLAELRFHAGTTSFMELLDAQRQVLASQSDLIQAELAERQARIDLYLALGGGWLNSP